MRISVFAFLYGAAFVVATPVDPAELEFSRAILEGRQTASGCRHYASPTCCLPGVCLCQNGWIYHINLDQMRGGGHGCDPPWGVIARSRAGHPGYCCRELPNGELEIDSGEVVEESAIFEVGPEA